MFTCRWTCLCASISQSECQDISHLMQLAVETALKRLVNRNGIGKHVRARKWLRILAIAMIGALSQLAESTFVFLTLATRTLISWSICHI